MLFVSMVSLIKQLLLSNNGVQISFLHILRPRGIYALRNSLWPDHTHTCTFYSSTPHRSLLVMGIYWTVWALPNHTNTSKWQINGKLKDRHVTGADYRSQLLILLIRLVGEAMPLAKPQIPEKVMEGKIAHVTQSKLDESAVHCHSPVVMIT